jgi:polyribonucleotide nucleotidyltransferase
MSQKGISTSFTMSNGQTVTIETGKLAKQADGSVVVRVGNMMLLATVCSNKEAKDGVDFMPLTVDFQEKFAADGRFPGGFLRREGRLSDYEILVSRLVDRALRPLFPSDYHADTQVLVSLISSDATILPDAYAALAASAAIAMSDVPFLGAISEARVAKIDGKLCINPLRADLERATMELIVSASAKDINMVEGEAKECSEDEMIEAIKFAHEEIRKQIAAQEELAKLFGAKPKRTYSHEASDLELKATIEKYAYQCAYDIAAMANPNKNERSQLFGQITTDFKATLTEEVAKEKSFLIKQYVHDVEKKAVRDCVLATRIRLDGRALDQVRPIWSEVGYLPTPHGSAIFTRGETQSLTTVTLGSNKSEQMIDGVTFEGTNNFLLHYNFPPFSTGEARPMRGTGRREVGHGNLAMRGLRVMLPEQKDCPYTIRIVSDILESNGSSSMATVCAGTLALMDAGVKLKKPVAGIAMGLITEGGKHAILSDILGDEDHLGDMDFKVTGTVDGITACQMDIKVDGLSYEVLAQALAQAKNGRVHILGEMAKTMSAPREDYKQHVPRIEQIIIGKEFIGAVIGPGGKVIQEMQRETNTTISIEEVGETGVVQIFSNNKEGLLAAITKIKNMTAVPEIGAEYDGKIKTIVEFGAFVEIMPGKDALLHISEVSHERLEKMDGIFKEGEIVRVKLIGVDPKTKKLKISRKALIEKPVATA